MFRNAYDLLLLVLVVVIAGLWSFSGAGWFPGSLSGTTPTPPAATPPPAPDDAHLRLDPAGGSLNNGDRLVLEVRLNTQGDEVGGVDVYLEFDETKLSLNEVVDNGLFPAFTSDEVTPGRWRLTANVASPGDTGFSGEDTFATVNFDTKAIGRVDVKFGAGTILSVGGQDLNPLTLGGSYTIN